MQPSQRRSHLARASFLLSSSLIVHFALADDVAYSGDHGPGFWGQTAGWETCGRGGQPGARQTPIDIRDTTPDPHLKKLDLHIVGTEVSLLNNGHTIEQEYERGGQLNLNGTAYRLQQFHFHTLSEHAVNGHRGVMELHAVFKNPADNTLAVIGVMYEIGKGNRFLDRLMEAGLPKKSGEHIQSNHTIDLNDALTDTAAYYTYAGSLTTPPCSETVTWIVLKHPATLSEAQFKAFNEILGDNFRPLQARNGRAVRRTVDREHD